MRPVVNSDKSGSSQSNNEDDQNENKASDRVDPSGKSNPSKVAANTPVNGQGFNSNKTISNLTNSNKKTDENSKNSIAKQSSNLPELNQNKTSKIEQEQLNRINQDPVENTQNSIAKNTENIPDIENKSIPEQDNLTEIDESPSIEDVIAIAENTNEKEKEEEKLNRWNISPSVAPVYFNTLGEGSSIHDQFVGNSKNGDLNMSYGLGGSYAISKKLKIRAGVHKVNLGYDTNNVIAYNGIGARNNEASNIKYNGNANATVFISAESFNLNSTPEILNTNIKGSLEQRLGFIEIPLEVEYSLIDKKIGLKCYWWV